MTTLEIIDEASGSAEYVVVTLSHSTDTLEQIPHVSPGLNDFLNNIAIVI